MAPGKVMCTRRTDVIVWVAGMAVRTDSAPVCGLHQGQMGAGDTDRTPAWARGCTGLGSSRKVLWLPAPNKETLLIPECGSSGCSWQED